MDRQPTRAGRAAILIIHALVWAAAMIAMRYAFKETAWGEGALLWMIAGFNLGNGLLLLALGRSKRC